MEPGTTVRAIEYEIVPKNTMAKIGVPQAEIERLGPEPEVAVLRCIAPDGDKLTALGDARRLRKLLASGEAGDPAGMRLRKREFPVVLRGWLKAS